MLAPAAATDQTLGPCQITVVAAESAEAVPAVFVTVMITLINLLASLEVKTYVESMAPEIFE